MEETSWFLQTLRGRIGKSQARSVHMLVPTGDFPSTRAVHSAIAELIHPYNTIKYMHIPGGRARCHAQSPSNQEQMKHTQYDRMRRLPSKNNERFISISRKNIYLIKSSIQCSHHVWKKYCTPYIWITIEAGCCRRHALCPMVGLGT